jgi:lipase chaperone LimK
MSKYIPISVFVPGSYQEELGLTPSEARSLVKRLQRQLETWETLLAKYGPTKARIEMNRLNDASHTRRRGA